MIWEDHSENEHPETVAAKHAREGDIDIIVAEHTSGWGIVSMAVETPKGLMGFIVEKVPPQDQPQFILGIITGQYGPADPEMDPEEFMGLPFVEKLQSFAEEMYSRLDREALDAAVAEMLAKDEAEGEPEAEPEAASA